MKVFNCANIKFLIKNSFSKTLSTPSIFSSFSTDPISTPNQPDIETPQGKPLKIKKIYRFDLSPHAFWLTQGKGMERPYTGDYWFTKDTGHYVCLGCSNRLFLSEHKFFPPTGMASFWTHISKAVETVADDGEVHENFENIIDKKQTEAIKKQRCVCAKCKSHLGLVYLDGPAPTFLRFSINSGGIKFLEKPYFENPLRIKERKKKAKMVKKIKEKEVKLPEFVFDKKKYYETAKK